VATRNKYIVLSDSDNEKDGETWREVLHRWLVRCPQCKAQWLVVGARKNDPYVCKDCGHAFPVELSDAA